MRSVPADVSATTWLRSRLRQDVLVIEHMFAIMVYERTFVSVRTPGPCDVIPER